MGILTVKMPDIGEGVVEGEVVEWLKKVGDPIKQDEPIVIVMTDKATVELPAPKPGFLAKQYYAVGQIAIRDKPLYDIETDEMEKAPQTKETPSVSKAENITPKKIPTQTGKALAIPPIRKLAKEMGIDIQTIQGTGKEGRITIDDLKKQVGSLSFPVVEREDDEIVPLVGIRHLMAKKMKESKQVIPHFSYFEQVDATRLIQLRENFKKEAEKEGIHLTYIPFIIRALSLTLKKYPTVNSSLDPSSTKLALHKHHHVGIAMSTSLGLIVPVLKEVQNLSLFDLIRAYHELKQKAMANKLSPSDMKDGTISISNFGVLGNGGLWATPIINYPEAAILALAKIKKQPLVRNNTLVVRDVLNLSWSFDHRIIDGDLAAHFSHHFTDLLQNPAALL